MANVIVNGKTYKCPNGNISVINNRVYCNGELVTDTNDIDEKEIYITVEGHIVDLSIDSGNATINGTAEKVHTQCGNISVGMDVLGECKTTTGDITVRGNVYGGCKTVSGDINATYVAKKPQDLPESMRRSYASPEHQIRNPYLVQQRTYPLYEDRSNIFDSISAFHKKVKKWIETGEW